MREAGFVRFTASRTFERVAGCNAGSQGRHVEGRLDHARLGVALFALLSTVMPTATAQLLEFPEPSDDRWHYPFNFTPGGRTHAPCFGATGDPDFNDRDGGVIVGWATDAQIKSGQHADAYKVQRVVVTLSNESGATWAADLSVDDWTTYTEAALDTDPGRPIELFGVGFGPMFTPSTWLESSLFIGAAGAGILPRDPFPFVYQENTLDALHVEDSVKGLHNGTLLDPVYEFTPTPWSVGEPVDYTPGNQPVPFDVVFDIDLSLSHCAVRRYFQDGLDDGRIRVFVTSLHETTMGGDPTAIPMLFMRDAVGLDPDAKPGVLQVVLSGGFGDSDGDGLLRLEDAARLPECLQGPLDAGTPICTCDVFDSNGDGDVDLHDYAEVQISFDGDTVR